MWVARNIYNAWVDLIRNDANLTNNLNLALLKTPIVQTIDFNVTTDGTEADFAGYTQKAIGAAVRPTVTDPLNGLKRIRMPSSSTGFENFQCSSTGTTLQVIYGWCLLNGVNGDPLASQTLILIERFRDPINMTNKGSQFFIKVPEFPIDLRGLV